MCGIAGIVGRLSTGQVHRSLRVMLEAQLHRGPDDGGLSVIPAGSGTVGLGNRRLAIQDLSPLGHQPMVNEATGDIIVYNGEIYNAPALRDLLKTDGLQFQGHSDTEVLMRAYERWGTECLKRLRGMFAFALWDARRSRLIITRDPMGIKPLYYAVKKDSWFVFASEVRALLQSGLPDARIDRLIDLLEVGPTFGRQFELAAAKHHRGVHGVAHPLARGEAIGVVNLDTVPSSQALETVRQDPRILSLSVIKLPPLGAGPPWLGA